MELSDSFGRSFRYLRLSVTDICDFRCVYCLPQGYIKNAAREPELTVSEIRNLVEGFTRLGVTKIRLTGGEPTTRKDIVEIARAVKSVGAVKRLALTTNGYRLKALAQPLREAGVDAINISADAADDERFGEITGGKNLRRVLDGVAAAVQAGFESIKINAVLLRDLNDGDIEPLIEWTREQALSVRFIELMQTAKNGEFFARRFKSASIVKGLLLQAGWTKVDSRLDDGPAEVFSHAAYRGSVGVIAPYSKGFCDRCNRLRVNSRGGLRLCLFGKGDVTLRPWLGDPARRPELIDAIVAALKIKPPSHYLHEGNYGDTPNLAALGG